MFNKKNNYDFSLSWVEISRDFLIRNLSQFRKLVGQKVNIMAVVKANAYGHGILETSGILTKGGVDWFGVNSLDEGIVLRDKGIKSPILVMGSIAPMNLQKALINDLSFVVWSREVIKRADIEAKKIKKNAKIHLKVETGTNRLGVKPEEILSLAKFALLKKNVFLEGIYTHFANIEDTLAPNFARKQLKTFEKTLQLIKQLSIDIPIKHTACTAATILFDNTHFNLVRIGIGLYGLWSSRETRISAAEKKIQLNLKPVLSWKTKIVQVKNVPKDESVGYGRTFITSRKSKIAIIPIGYWDGYDRGLSNCGRVLVKGKFAPVVGRVCMNMTIIDVTDIVNVKVNDEVALIGKQGKNEITADEIAQKLGTINYEIVTRINPEIPRKIVL